MRDGTYGAFRATGPARVPARLIRVAVLAAVIGAWLAVAAALQPATAAADDTIAGSVGDFAVGHRTEPIEVRGSDAGETRLVDVQLWYPADEKGLSADPKTEYKSRLWGDTRLPQDWTPLSWKVAAEIAREDANIYPDGAPFPVIVFSHGNQNDPIDYAHTLELIASAGFVVAAPQHVNNSQDDVRIDYVNTLGDTTPPLNPPLIPCNDGRPSPCSRGIVARSMQDRVRDISHTLDALPGWFVDRVKVKRAGVLGHSRGTVTALAAAGGSTTWGFGPATWGPGGKDRVKAIMGLAIGTQSLTSNVNFANVTVPTLLVAGGLDGTSPPGVSKTAHDSISSTDKELVEIAKAGHRSFDSTYCDQTQRAGALAQGDPNAKLDLHTVKGIVAPTGGSAQSGKATEYCNSETFTQPVDIRPLVKSITGVDFPQNVPTTGLDTNAVKGQVAERAATFFGRTLK